METLNKRRLICCLGLIAITLLLVWGNSLLPGSASAQVSSHFGRLLSDWIPSLSPNSPHGSHLLRKCAHFAEFFLLGNLLCWLVSAFTSHKLQIFTLALTMGITVAAIDEGIQRFIPGRSGSWKDVLLDSCGVLAGVILAMLFISLYAKHQQKSSQ